MTIDMMADKKACKLAYTGSISRDFWSAWKTIGRARGYDLPFHLYRESLIKEAREDWGIEALEAACNEYVTRPW